MTNQFPSVCRVVPTKEIGEQVCARLKLYMPEIKTRIESTHYGIMVIIDVETDGQYETVTKCMHGIGYWLKLQQAKQDKSPVPEN